MLLTAKLHLAASLLAALCRLDNEAHAALVVYLITAKGHARMLALDLLIN